MSELPGKNPLPPSEPWGDTPRSPSPGTRSTLSAARTPHSTLMPPSTSVEGEEEKSGEVRAKKRHQWITPSIGSRSSGRLKKDTPDLFANNNYDEMEKWHPQMQAILALLSGGAGGIQKKIRSMKESHGGSRQYLDMASASNTMPSMIQGMKVPSLA